MSISSASFRTYSAAAWGAVKLPRIGVVSVLLRSSMVMQRLWSDAIGSTRRQGKGTPGGVARGCALLRRKATVHTLLTGSPAAWRVAGADPAAAVCVFAPAPAWSAVCVGHWCWSGQVNLSRLNHRLPRAQANTEVMQGTTDFHDQIADALFPQPEPVFDDATALDTTVDMLNAQSAIVQGLIG